MSFGADVGAIWRMNIDTVSKAVLTAIRYHGDANGRCEVSARRVAAMAGVSRSTLFQRVAQLVTDGLLTVSAEKGGESVYTVVIGAEPVREMDGVPVRHTDPPRPGAGLPPSAIRTPPVRELDGSPTPPNREFETFSRLLPDAAAAPAPAQTHTRETGETSREDFAQVEAAWSSARRSVSSTGRGSGCCLSDLEARGLLKLCADFGAGRVVEAIGEAALGNTRDGLSVNFVRSVLERMAANRPRGRPGGRDVAVADAQPRDRMLSWDEVVERLERKEVGT